MSKELTSTVAPRTMHRLRTYRAYLRTQPQTGWNHQPTQNGALQLTAIAGAGH